MINLHSPPSSGSGFGDGCAVEGVIVEGMLVGLGCGALQADSIADVARTTKTAMALASLLLINLLNFPSEAAIWTRCYRLGSYIRDQLFRLQLRLYHRNR